jgi:hypothetical protein
MKETHPSPTSVAPLTSSSQREYENCGTVSVHALPADLVIWSERYQGRAHIHRLHS